MFKRAKRAHTDKAKLARLQRQVQALRPEVKLFEFASSFVAVTPGVNAINYLSSLQQGTDGENRIGDVITPKFLHLRIRITTKGALPGQGLSTTYFAVVKDKESNGTLPSIAGPAGIYLNNSPTGAVPTDESLEKYKVLWSRTTSGYAIENIGQSYYECKIPLSGKMTFHGNSSAQSTAGKNALYIVCMTDDTSNTVAASYFGDIWFTDS